MRGFPSPRSEVSNSGRHPRDPIHHSPMMAPEPTPPAVTLGEETLHELRVLLIRYVREGVELAEMPDFLRRLNDEAHRKHMTAEQVLIALKRVWFSIPEVRSAGDSEAGRVLLHRIVSLSIQQFYER